MSLDTENGNTINDLDKQIEKLWRAELISENEVRLLCDKAREIFISEGNVQRVDLPVTVYLLHFIPKYTFIFNLF